MQRRKYKKLRYHLHIAKINGKVTRHMNRSNLYSCFDIVQNMFDIRILYITADIISVGKRKSTNTVQKSRKFIQAIIYILS